MTSAIAVIGGGVAGCAAATLLARAGHRVVLFDEHREPRHKMCGEFLSVEACDSLRALGLDPVTLGAVPVSTVRLMQGASAAEAPLPFPALSLTRKRLDAELLRLAASAGVELRLGCRVNAISYGEPGAVISAPAPSCDRPSGSNVLLADGSTHHAQGLFLATGKHDLREHRRPRPRGRKLVAFKQYFQLRPAAHDALHEAVELHLFRSGYAGLQLVENGDANLCLLIDQRCLATLNGWPGVLEHVCREAPQLGERIAGAAPVLAHPLALSHIPYGFLASPQPGPWRLGDQAAVIPSFTGDGIAIALHSAQVTVASFLAGESPAAATAQLRADLSRNLRRATRLAQLLLTPGLNRGAVALASTFPGVLALLANATRISMHARRRLASAAPPVGPRAPAYNEQG